MYVFLHTLAPLSTNYLPLKTSADHSAIHPNEEALCSADVYTTGWANTDTTSWLNYSYAEGLGAQNLTFITTPESLQNHPVATSTPKADHSTMESTASVDSLTEEDITYLYNCSTKVGVQNHASLTGSGVASTQETITNDHSTNECLVHEDVEILKSALYLYIQRVLARKIEADCYGCSVNHPSQRQHSCLYEPSIYYFERCYDTICEWFFIPELQCALAHVLHATRGKTVSPHRLLGVAEVVLSDLRSEPYIVDRLKDATRNVKFKKSVNGGIILQSADTFFALKPDCDEGENDV